MLQPVWYHESDQVEKAFGPGSWPIFQRGSFRYRWILTWRWTGFRRSVETVRFYITEALRAHREKPIDCVMTYSHLTPALCGIVIKMITGAKLIVEIATSPDRSYLHDRPQVRIIDHLRRWYSDWCLHASMWACDCAHVLYPGALDSYPLLRRTRKAVFHEFVPVSAVPRHESAAAPYILLLGAPWYLKGADILIKAFNQIRPDFPDVQLKIMGHYPDRQELETLTRGDERIEILPARHHRETLQIISRAAVLVLPSRSEGMGRVLIEAMAAGVPVIGSNVGGIPTVIHDGENGFLFPVEDSGALEQHLRRLLSDPELRARLGQCGFRMAHELFDERAYVKAFVSMIELTLGAAPSRRHSDS